MRCRGSDQNTAGAGGGPTSEPDRTLTTQTLRTRRAHLLPQTSVAAFTAIRTYARCLRNARTCWGDTHHGPFGSILFFPNEPGGGPGITGKRRDDFRRWPRLVPTPLRPRRRWPRSVSGRARKAWPCVVPLFSASDFMVSARFRWFWSSDSRFVSAAATSHGRVTRRPGRYQRSRPGACSCPGPGPADCSAARRASSARELMPSLRKTCLRWNATT